MAKNKTTKDAPKAKKAKKATDRTITNLSAQHRTVCVGPDSIPLPAGASEPLPEKAAEWCKNSAAVQGMIKEKLLVINPPLEESESTEE